MSTYYKFAERNVQNDVNWAEIGKNLTDMLQEQNKLREEKKAAIDESSRQFGQVLESNPIGENDNLNKWSLDYASNAKEARLLQDRLLKRGILSVKDYTVMRQNITDGTNNAFGLLTEWNTLYKEKMDRYAKGESAFQEQFEMEINDGLSNFSKTALYISPTDYTVSVGNKIKDPKTGQMILDPDRSKYSTISSLKARMNEKINKFDVVGKLTAISGTLGEYITTAKAAGVEGASTVESVLLSPEYQKTEGNIIESLMVDPRNVGSILTDFVKTAPNGQTYTFTLDPKAVDANHILLKEDPNQPSSGRLVPSLTPEQEKDAKDKVQSRLRTMLDYKVTPEQKFAPPAPYRPTEADYARGDEKKQKEDIASNLGLLYTGTEAQQDMAANYFKGLKPEIKDIVKQDDNLVITYKNGDPAYILPFKDSKGAIIPYENWTTGATVLSGMSDTKRVLKSVGFTGKEVYSTATGGAKQGVKTPAYNEAYVAVNDGEGKMSPKGLDDYFNSTFKRGTNFKFYSETETAKNAAAVVTTILQTLPPSATSQMSIAPEEVGGVTNVRISLPSVMKGVIRIPMKKGANLESEIKRIIKNIYDLASSAKSGETFISSDALIDKGKESTTKKVNYKPL
jgi:hypothetical protein